MSITLAFDVYGTLLDTQGVVDKLEKTVGNKAVEFSQTWRNKQLEYTFRRALMQRYENFAVCVSNALDYTCMYYKATLTDEQKTDLLDAYRALPAFNDVKDCLPKLQENKNFLPYAFSNGSAETIETLLGNAGIRNYFIDIVSADEIKTFKPNPDIYNHFLTISGSATEDAWLISSNPFDIIGAISAGMKAAWVKRSEEIIFDPWGIEPTITVNDLSALLVRINETTKTNK